MPKGIGAAAGVLLVAGLWTPLAGASGGVGGSVDRGLRIGQCGCSGCAGSPRANVGHDRAWCLVRRCHAVWAKARCVVGALVSSDSIPQKSESPLEVSSQCSTARNGLSGKENRDHNRSIRISDRGPLPPPKTRPAAGPEGAFEMHCSLPDVDDFRDTSLGRPGGPCRNADEDDLDVHGEVDSASRSLNRSWGPRGDLPSTAQIVKVAHSDATVLITGESGPARSWSRRRFTGGPAGRGCPSPG